MSSLETRIVSDISKTGIEVKKFYGVMWTLQDFILQEDITLKNGTVLLAGKRFFTWNEAMELQRIGAFPKGCRLPTAKEFRSLIKNVRALTMRNRLNFDTYYGCLDYVHDGEPKLLVEGRNGFYWSSSSGAKHNAVTIEISRFKIAGREGWALAAWQKTAYRDYGNSIRLVYDPKQ